MPNLELGKYAIYILPAYTFTALVWIVIVIATLLRTRRWKREVERLEGLKASKKA